MAIVVVVGGQFGGEGKGKITAYLCREYGNTNISHKSGGEFRPPF
jgi:adenylosuccinate synthase